MRRASVAVGLGIAAMACEYADGQSRYLMNDRTNDAIFFGIDSNDDGVIDDMTEVMLFFDATNAAGTIGPSNPTTLTISGAGAVAMGDQGNGNVYLLRDANCDGDAQGPGESIVYADASNAGGFSFAFPTGADFGPDGALYVVNAGNAFGNDRIFRLEDLNGDGDAQDAGEITEYVGAGAFGAGNGPFSPQEIFFDGAVGYLRNSSSGLTGVYRFEDVNGNGAADDPGEFTVFWDATNAAGTPAGFGFALTPDRARDNAMYTLQLASGGIDQLVRLHDMNGDDDAQDPGESAIVWSTAEAGFTSVDLECTDVGDVLISENSTSNGTDRVIIRLTDSNGDGDFMDAGERVDFYSDPGTTLAALRQFDAVRLVGDLDDDGVVNVFDLLELLGNWGEDGPGADLDDPANIVNVFDLLALLARWGNCL